jgi:hypothetical protein
MRTDDEERAAMRFCIRLLIVICCSVSTASFGAVIIDEFDTNSLAGPNWGPVNNLGTGGHLVVANGQLQYRADNLTADDFAAVNWNVPPAALAQNWTFTMELSLASLTLLDTQRLLLGLEVVDPQGQVTLGFDSLLGTTSQTTHQIVGQDKNGVRTQVDCTPASECGGVATLGNDVSLRMTYTAATQTLTTEFDPDGGSNSFVNLATNAGFIPSALFVFGQSSGIAVSAGQAGVNKVETTLVPAPEPRQYAFMLAGSALLIVALRRNLTRHRAASRAPRLR